MFVNDANIINYSLTILNFASDGSMEQIREVLELDIIERVYGLFCSTSETRIPVLKLLNNLSYGSDKQTNVNKITTQKFTSQQIFIL